MIKLMKRNDFVQGLGYRLQPSSIACSGQLWTPYRTSESNDHNFCCTQSACVPIVECEPVCMKHENMIMPLLFYLAVFSHPINCMMNVL